MRRQTRTIPSGAEQGGLSSKERDSEPPPPGRPASEQKPRTGAFPCGDDSRERAPAFTAPAMVRIVARSVQERGARRTAALAIGTRRCEAGERPSDPARAGILRSAQRSTSCDTAGANVARSETPLMGKE